ncbi:MAG: ABC transporter ATP-binding protein, partial [Bacillota bacterium]|nr:ABC transporter ATP-binding protein [Bacillota bacterium]
MSVLLKAEHFSFSYPGTDKKAIDDVSFELKKGEILLLCGASGSGKSTLLHSIKREISPVGKREGKLLWKGRDMDGLSREELTSSIAMVFQNPESQTVMDTVLSEMAFALENMGQKSADIRRKVSEVCGYFGLSDILHKSPHRISGGQRQMVNLCAALAIRPELILFDEPFSQLDPVAQNDLLTIIRRVNREFGITIMLSEHKTEELASVCDRLMFLDGGKISYFGEPHGVAKDMIQKDDRKALSFLPSPVRIYASLGGIPGEAPLSIREGREFIAPYVSRITLRKEENEPEKAEGKTALTADNLLFSYPDSARPVIKNLDLSIKCGDFCAIMGGNGSGKSTLLKLLCGLLAPQDGKIRIGGRDIAKMPREE